MVTPQHINVLILHVSQQSNDKTRSKSVYHSLLAHFNVGYTSTDSKARPD